MFSLHHPPSKPLSLRWCNLCFLHLWLWLGKSQPFSQRCIPYVARWSSGLRLRPLTPATGVRIPYGSPLLQSHASFCRSGFTPFPIYLVGAYSGEVPPVPIPNTAVKLTCAYDTWRVTAWENRSAPTPPCGSVTPSWGNWSIYSSIAQLVEHAAVNRRVVGSSPTWGAICKSMPYAKVPTACNILTRAFSSVG